MKQKYGLLLALGIAGAAGITGYSIPAAEYPAPQVSYYEDEEEAPSPEVYDFHCGQDTVDITSMLSVLEPYADEPMGKLLCRAAELLEGRPYVANTLGYDDKALVINVHGLDCVTFVESCYALANTARSGSGSWRDYARSIENIRYRRGRRVDYASRLHYATDWFGDNIYRGNITDITPTIACHRSVLKTLDFMTKHPDSYPAFKDKEQLQKCRDLEMGFRSMKIPYIPKSAAGEKAVVEALEDGDMISFVSNKEGLDSSHVALLRKRDGKLYMMHASLKKGKVTFETAPLSDYFKYSKKDSPGFRVVRFK
ncbi:MAG: DUF1460 domain-containing protein [Porphyromonadaceae bacterium]|jgi:hypothetical protein|nr:DUF1460 domain-containing protein [Porphyromonadaceae bacterium]MDD6314114.1 DUF1460 domain-containing protein [Porphyromonadaceae bacterium]